MKTIYVILRSAYRCATKDLNRPPRHDRGVATIPYRPPSGCIHFNSISGHFANLIGDPFDDVKILGNVQFVLKGSTVVKSELLKQPKKQADAQSTACFCWLANLVHLAQSGGNLLDIRYHRDIIIFCPRYFALLVHDENRASRNAFLRQVHAILLAHCSFRVKIGQ